MDLSEGDYGVSLLNDCKYGHDIRDNSPQGGVMRISLLRSPTMPDPEADQGEHRFAYSLLPHAGSWGETTIAQAYALNDPLIVAQPESQASALQPVSLLSAEPANIVVETIKRAEDGNGLIVRFMRASAGGASYTWALNLPAPGAPICWRRTRPSSRRMGIR